MLQNSVRRTMTMQLSGRLDDSAAAQDISLRSLLQINRMSWISEQSAHAMVSVPFACCSPLNDTLVATIS